MPDTSAPPSGHRLWSFYWPLSLMGVAMLTGRLVQNAVLLDVPAGVRELAAFAIALAVAMPIQNVFGFLPQATNVLARSRVNRHALWRFAILGGLLFTVPLLLLGWTPMGRAVVVLFFDLDLAVVDRVLTYFRWLAPVVLIAAAGGVAGGLLVQVERTGRLTLLRIACLGLTVLILIVGLAGGWSPVITIVASKLLPDLVNLMVQLLWLRDVGDWPEQDERPLSQWAICRYFAPMAVNTAMFALSRPIIFSWITGLTALGVGATAIEAIIGALTLAFTFNFIFQSAVNQFRHVWATFGAEHPTVVRRFLNRITLAVVVLVVLGCITPLNRWYFTYLQGAEGEVLSMAVEAMWFLLPMPVVITWRNHLHGRAMVGRRTLAMGVGGVMRNAAVWCGGWALLATGWLDHRSAALLLILGFAAEGATVWVASRGWNRLSQPAFG